VENPYSEQLNRRAHLAIVFLLNVTITGNLQAQEALQQVCDVEVRDFRDPDHAGLAVGGME